MNRKEVKDLAGQGVATVLLSELADESDTIGGTRPLLSMIVYSGESALLLNPQKNLDNLAELKARIEGKATPFIKEILTVIESQFEAMNKYVAVYKEFEHKVDNLFARVQAGEFNAESKTSDGSTDRDQTGTDTVS